MMTPMRSIPGELLALIRILTSTYALDSSEKCASNVLTEPQMVGSSPNLHAVPKEAGWGLAVSSITCDGVAVKRGGREVRAFDLRPFGV
ncbi:hypothetical protein OH76DRAFT_612979 [Lentinus brumalis]|uniref:Uncharacterized protein n=1 Tax=Lentinus brumalis TaxID=2498619 RepID=A0A371D8Q9_9APHY|nr:hypothetical protein OH76DRAFT_612979 [Polyporus brumalis]